jgi:hypothetical protein
VVDVENHNADEQIQKAIETGKPVIIKTCKLGRDTEEYILHVLELFLNHIGKSKILDQLSYCVRELLNNAKKANIKRAFFEDEKLDIKNPIAVESTSTVISKKILTIKNIFFILQCIYFLNLSWFFFFS